MPSRSRVLINRVLLVVALLSIALGIVLGQALITWLNATVLCLSCIGIQ
ncbi:MAG: hypothetical protein ACP5Q1_00330 [Anaerolineae bacterium]